MRESNDDRHCFFLFVFGFVVDDSEPSAACWPARYSNWSDVVVGCGYCITVWFIDSVGSHVLDLLKLSKNNKKIRAKKIENIIEKIEEKKPFKITIKCLQLICKNIDRLKISCLKNT